MDKFRISQAVEAFLSNIKKTQPQNTWRSYRSDLVGRMGFVASLAPAIKPSADLSRLTEEMAVAYIQDLLDRGDSPATRQRKTTSIREFFRFAASECKADLQIDRLNYKLRARHLLAGRQEKIDFPAQKIERVLAFTLTIKPIRTDLQMLRDLAFIWTLAETGLRISEACGLTIGQIDRRWRVTFIGKGAKEGTARFGKNSRALIQNYLRARATLDASTGLPRATLPLFARHDQTSGKNKVKRINVRTGENILHALASLALGDEYDPKITAHKFRHYFVTMVYRKTGGDLKAAQELARHESIVTTQRYAHRDSEQNAETSEKVFG